MSAYLAKFKNEKLMKCNLDLRCYFRDYFKQNIKEVLSIDIHIRLMNYTVEELEELCKTYYDKEVWKIKLLVLGEKYYKKDYGKTRRESTYMNFYVRL